MTARIDIAATVHTAPIVFGGLSGSHGARVLAVAAAICGIGCIAVDRRHRIAVLRRCASLPVRRRAGHGDRDRERGVVPRWRSIEAWVGRGPRRLVRRPADHGADRRLGRALVAGGVAAAVGAPRPLVVGLGFAAWAVPWIVAAMRRSHDRSAALDEAPEVIDLIRLGVASGLNVRLALEAVVRHHRGRIVAELQAVLDRAERGDRLADALDGLGDSHLAAEGVRPLIDALVATERYGAPLVASLDRVAADARTARRRRREEAARRVPVKLLFPLVFCTLPAFALLTVVPVVLRSLPSLTP